MSMHDDLQIDEDAIAHTEISAADEPQGDSNNAERSALKQARRQDARDWAPREDVAVIHVPIELGHPALRRAWNVMFVRTQIAHHMLQRVLPDNGGVEPARAVENLLYERLAALEQNLADELARINAVAAKDGIEEFPAKSYTAIEKLNVPVFTPSAARYLRLLRGVDELLWRVEYLWLQGSIQLAHKFQLVNAWKRLLWGFVRFSVETWVRARRSLQDAQRHRNDRAAQRQSRAPGATGASAAEAGEGAEPVAAAA